MYKRRRLLGLMGGLTAGSMLSGCAAAFWRAISR